MTLEPGNNRVRKLLYPGSSSSISNQARKFKNYNFYKKVDDQRERLGKNKSLGDEITVMDVPDPVPDTGIYPSANEVHATHDGPLFASPTTAPISVVTGNIVTAISLPVAMTTLIVSDTLVSSPTIILPSATIPPQREIPIHLLANSHRRTSVAIIILLAAGSAFFLASLAILLRWCSRPRHRVHPTPSLPILKDELDDEDLFRIEGSPLFGGKERLSRPGSNGLWTWTQFPQPTFVVSRPGSGDGGPTPEPLSCTKKGTEVDQQKSVDKSSYPFIGYSNNHALTPANPFEQVQSADTSRMSAASISLYPNSIVNGIQMGAAVSETPPLAPGDYPIIKRSKSKEDRRLSRKYTEDPGDGNGKHNGKRYSQGLAYDGADVSSPSLGKVDVTRVPSASAAGGRSRVKSTYYSPSVYRRMSAVPPLSLAPTSTKGDLSNVNDPSSQHTLRKSNSRWERDTRALTSALGLATPDIDRMISSPQPTLYPDDSLSIVGDPFRSIEDTMPVPKLPSLTGSATDANITLGNLMLSGFPPTSKSLASLSGREILAQANSSRSINKNFRTEDKPPRVPSPPPLPSLTQMAMAHANPEAYETYRSPTYSIYKGLCDDDVKDHTESGSFNF
jgi:hypothetical protein